VKRSVAVMSPARLRVEHAQLVVEQGDGASTVPLEDLGVLLVDSQEVEITSGLLSALGERRIALVACGENKHPCALMLPISGHSTSPQILRGQIRCGLPSKKRLWQAIVRAKIEAQERLLVEATGSGHGLGDLAKQVRSGDTTNREAVAAMAYFEALFEPGFVRLRSRDFEGEPELFTDGERGVNALLNYGYAVLRAYVARAVVLAGLHPALGVHHHHRENAFALADDLMEPLRPMVDRRVRQMLDDGRVEAELTPALKRELMRFVTEKVRWKGARWPLDAALEAYASGVRGCLLNEGRLPDIPGA
jgi:CRISP-associated protein Cas1